MYLLSQTTKQRQSPKRAIYCILINRNQSVSQLEDAMQMSVFCNLHSTVSTALVIYC